MESEALTCELGELARTPYTWSMSGGARKVKTEPARDALARAPAGPPLTDEERARLEAIAARGAVEAVPHDEIVRQLDERKRLGR